MSANLRRFLSSQRFYWAATLGLVLLLTTLKLGHVPQFSKDAQYYVQSALLWPSGQVSFAGSLVGERHLTIGYYSLFLQLFGSSLDAITLSLAALFAAHSLLVAGIVAALDLPRPAKLLLTTAANLLSFFSPIWMIPASEPTFTMGLTLLVFAWAWIWPRRRHGFWLLLGLAALAGWSAYFRAGSLLFVLGVAAAVALYGRVMPMIRAGLPGTSVLQEAKPGSRAVPVVFAMLLLAIGYWGGSRLGAVSWRLWVPAEKPPAYTVSMLLYKPILTTAGQENGPTSARIYEEMDIRPRSRLGFKDSLGYWKMLGFTYERYGAAESEALVSAVGWEALRAHPWDALQSTLLDFMKYLISPGVLVTLHGEDAAQQIETARKSLRELDQYRLETTYLPDIATPVAAIAENRLPALEAVRRIVPAQRLELSLPGFLALVPLLLALLSPWFYRERVVLDFLPFSAMALGVLLLSAFSQGYIYRYSAPFLLMSLIMTVAMPKSMWQSVWDFIGIPFRLVLFDQAWLPRFGWTTLEDERMQAVLPHVRGKLLDIGAGPNTLVRRYGSGTGVDVFDWKGGAMVVKDTACLPFAGAAFDTITFIACLNHIPNRGQVLQEARRLVRPGGRLIITMINPLLGDFGHAIWWYSEDKQRGGMSEGEVGGMWTSDIVRLCANAGFRLTHHRRFVYGMNNLYLFEPIEEGTV